MHIQTDKKPKQISQDDYRKAFKIKETKPKSEEIEVVPDQLKAAFKQVSDIRKFEIELYWKRAGYFWALIAVAFAGYFSILSAKNIPNQLFLSFVIASIGFVFTFAWYLTNRGSKFWQENWENHLDQLENKITGPLYKTTLSRPAPTSFSEKYITGPLDISVSKINQWVSVFVLFVWISLALYSFYKKIISINIIYHDFVAFSAIFLMTLATFTCCIYMYKGGKIDNVNYDSIAKQRTNTILQPKE